VAADVVDAVTAAQVDGVALRARLDAVTFADRLVALEHHERLGAGADAGEPGDQVGLELDVGVAGACARNRRNELFESLAFDGDGLEHRHAEQVLEQVAVDVDAALASLVGHVERDDHALAHVHELQREEEVALEVHGVDHVDDDFTRQDDVARDGLFVVKGADAVDAGGVDDVVLPYATARQLDGGAGEVAHVHVGAGQRVEDDRLADVGVAHQYDGLASCAHDRAPRRVTAGFAHCDELLCAVLAEQACVGGSKPRDAGVSCSTCGR